MTDFGNTSNVANFAIRLGYLVASLEDKAVVEYLREYAVTDQQMDRAKDALLSVAQAFYRERKR